MPVTRNTPRSGGLPLINPRERVDPRVRDAVNAYVRLYYPRILTELGAMSCSAGHALVVGYKPGISGTFYYRCRGKAGAKCTEGVRPLSFQLPERDRAALMSQVQPIFDDGEPEAGLDTLREECDAIRKERRSWRRDRLGERCFTLETRVANFIRERRALVLTRSDCRAIMWAAEAEYLSVRGEDDEAEVNFLKQQFLTAYRRYVEVMDSLKYATEEEVMARDDLAHLKKVFTHLDLQRPAIPGFQPYEGPSLGPSGGLRTFATDMVQLTPPTTPASNRISQMVHASTQTSTPNSARSTGASQGSPVWGTQPQSSANGSRSIRSRGRSSSTAGALILLGDSRTGSPEVNIVEEDDGVVSIVEERDEDSDSNKENDEPEPRPFGRVLSTILNARSPSP